MPKATSVESSAAAVERGVRFCYERIMSAYNERILICRSGGNSDAANLLIEIKGKLPNLTELLANAEKVKP